MNQPVTIKHIFYLVVGFFAFWLIFKVVSYPINIKQELYPWFWDFNDSSAALIYDREDIAKVSCKDNILTHSFKWPQNER